MKTENLQITNNMEVKNMSDEDKKMIEEALKVYGIPKHWVFASRVDKPTNTVVIVTFGGKKVIHKKGEAAKFKLSMVEISGCLPKEEMFWTARIKQGMPPEELKKPRDTQGG